MYPNKNKNILKEAAFKKKQNGMPCLATTPPPQLWGLYSPTLHFSISINSPNSPKKRKSTKLISLWLIIFSTCLRFLQTDSGAPYPYNQVLDKELQNNYTE
jgi:hypothetical protein